MLENIQKPVNIPSNQEFQYQLLQVLDAQTEIYHAEPREYFEICKESGVILRIKRRSMFRESGISTDYALRKQIDGDDFLFRIIKAFGYGEGTYSIDFMTERYNYALMNLSFEATRQLEQTVLCFIDTVFKTDEQVRCLRFSGAGSAYTKEEVDEARTVLKEKVEDKDYFDDTDQIDAYTLRDILSLKGIHDTKMQKRVNNIGSKRDRVFSKRLSKLFERYELPYSVEDSTFLSDAFIRRNADK